MVNYFRIVNDAFKGIIDEAYLNKLDDNFRDFASSLRNLFNTVSDQVTASIAEPQEVGLIYDETEESYF